MRREAGWRAAEQLRAAVAVEVRGQETASDCRFYRRGAGGRFRRMKTSGAARLQQVAQATARDRILIAARSGKGAAMEQTPDKVEALVATVAVLDEVRIPYALIGGVAVGVLSGVPRATLDTDLAVRSGFDRAALLAALRRAGFRLVGEFQHSVNLRHANGEPVQLAFDPDFDEWIARAERIKVGAVPIRIVRKSDLIEMKRRAAADPARRKSKALRDQADIELLLGDVPDPDEGW